MYSVEIVQSKKRGDETLHFLHHSTGDPSAICGICNSLLLQSRNLTAGRRSYCVKSSSAPEESKSEKDPYTHSVTPCSCPLMTCESNERALTLIKAARHTPPTRERFSLSPDLSKRMPRPTRYPGWHWKSHFDIFDWQRITSL